MSETTLTQALAACDEQAAKQLVQEKLEAGVAPAEIVAECNAGMLELGERFSRGECFIPELMIGGEIMKGIMADLGPRLSGQDVAGTRGLAVIGTVQYDQHDIGKDIVCMVLRGAGFEVVDLGVDVAPEKFVEAIREHQPAVVGMSLLLTTCYKSVTATVEAINSAGLRDSVRIMVGGAAASDLLAQNAGCDFYGKTAIDGLHYAVECVGA